MSEETGNKNGKDSKAGKVIGIVFLVLVGCFVLVNVASHVGFFPH